MFIQKHAIDSIGSAIEYWKNEADGDIISAKIDKENSLIVYKEFQDICASLKVMDCPFCCNEMLDTEPLKELSNLLSRSNIFLFQGERFTFSCKFCHIFLTEKPNNNLRYWTVDNIKYNSRIFAAYVFDNFLEVDKVVQGKMGSCPSWLFRINGHWYASDLKIDTLKKYWGI